MTGVKQSEALNQNSSHCPFFLVTGLLIFADFPTHESFMHHCIARDTNRRNPGPYPANRSMLADLYAQGTL